jgi:hypothetical protein
MAAEITLPPLSQKNSKGFFHLAISVIYAMQVKKVIKYEKGLGTLAVIWPSTERVKVDTAFVKIMKIKGLRTFGGLQYFMITGTSTTIPIPYVNKVLTMLIRFYVVIMLIRFYVVTWFLQLVMNQI